MSEPVGFEAKAKARRLRDLIAIEDDIKADTSRDGRDLLRVIGILKEMNR